MVIVDDVKITPNPVNAGKEIVISVALHETYEGAKRYAYRYGYRYGEKKGEK